MRAGVMGALAASLVFCAAGCGNRAASPDPGSPPEPGTLVEITLYVKDMTKVLEIT
jgi:hypothetical protein